MIPIRLEIEGLYSYKERQIIKFDQLTAAGLFGIFGAVGSGKSSILEAILLALYGSTERLSDRGEKNSMLNLQSDALLINFEFLSGKNNSQSFLGRYAAKRNPKKFEEVRPAEHTFYEKIEGNWEPISEKAEEIIGMKKEHFKQTVIIPQGKFREFIDLTPGPRAEMMKELFGLERFDLSGKTGSLLKVVREEKIRLETQLLALENYTQEAFESKKKEQVDLKIEAHESSLKLSLSETKLKVLENIKAKASQLQEFKKTWKELTEQKPEIERKRQLHKEFITAKTYLKPVWDQLNESNKDLEKYSTSVTDCERFKIRYEIEVKELEEEEEKLKEKNKERPHREGKIRDLKKVISLKQQQELLEIANRKLETLKPEIESKKEFQKQTESKIADLEKQSEAIESPDLSTFTALKTAVRDWKILQESSDKFKSDIKLLKNEIGEVRNNLHLISSKIPESEKTLASWKESQKNRILQLESERDKLYQKQGLNAHVHLLEDGKPCPLCGSEHHPNPLKAEKEKEELRSRNEEINREKEEFERILTLIQKDSEFSIHLDNHLRNVASKETEYSNLEKSRQVILNLMEENGLDSFEKLVSHVDRLSKSGEAKAQLLESIKVLRQSWTEQRTELEEAEKEFQKANLSQHSIASSIISKKEEIADPTFCKAFFNKEVYEIQATIEKVAQDIEQAIQLLEGKQKVLRKKREDQTANLTSLASFRNLKKETSAKLETLSSEFEKLKTKHGFRDEAVLVELFENSLDAEKVDLEIRSFDQRLAISESRITELESEEGVKTYDPEEFSKHFQTNEFLKSTHETLQNRLLLLEEELKITLEKLEEKNRLTEMYAKLENRETNLRELERLFKGSGFVKYVSSIYLKELCNTANMRFMKLSKNSLSLEIDDDNTFWVIDYLNGGKRRLLKTLSGGQTFQASLCLALALAEKVKALNQADQSFFFLDEGFGALDRNALRVVFETLKSLRHENRIVGIISHVEELQQEIGVYAQIELDPEKGSQISYSF